MCNNVCPIKQCTCSNGSGATGTNCPNNGDAKCASCNNGYYLNGTSCSVLSRCYSAKSGGGQHLLNYANWTTNWQNKNVGSGLGVSFSMNASGRDYTTAERVICAEKCRASPSGCAYYVMLGNHCYHYRATGNAGKCTSPYCYKMNC